MFGGSVSLESQDTLVKFIGLEKAEEDRFKAERKDILSQREPKDGESRKKKARGGAALRYRPSVKFKYKALLLIDKCLRDLTDAASLNDVLPPTLQDVFKVLSDKGVATSTNNLYKWYAKRSSITQRFLTEKKKRAKSVGSGRGPILKEVEDVVKRLIYQQREKHLRVSRSRAKVLLQEKAKELMPDQAAKFKFSKHYFQDAFRRCACDARTHQVLDLPRHCPCSINQSIVCEGNYRNCLSCIARLFRGTV